MSKQGRFGDLFESGMLLAIAVVILFTVMFFVLANDPNSEMNKRQANNDEPSLLKTILIWKIITGI